MKIGYLVIILSGLIFIKFGKNLKHSEYQELNQKKPKTQSQSPNKLKKEDKKLPYNLDSYQKLLILGLKEEKLLEVYGITENWNPKNENNITKHATKLKSFPFTGYSGELGPKLKEGDGQIPEGIYKIEYLNPNSSYHLSMKINYPNKFDLEKGKSDGRKKLGYDIFIHGNSVTVGCIPIGNSGIEDLYSLVSLIGIQSVDVIISPYDMRKKEKILEIKKIDWESQLYDQIKKAFNKIHFQQKLKI